MRTFLPEALSIKNWEQIETYFEDLNTRAIDSVEDLKKWMQDRSELEAVLEENMACLLYTSPSPRDLSTSRMPSSA